MKGKPLKIVLFLVVLAAAGLGYLELPTGSPEPTVTQPDGVRTVRTEQQAPAEAPPADGVLRVVESAAIKNYDKVIYRGPVDLSATIERIRAGETFPHRNDGSVFGNRERLLPSKPRGYYREYVHPTDGINGPGPQRLVVGKDGDWWYTPDHYASFIQLGTEARR